MQGLVTTERNNLDPAAAPFAKNPRDIEGLNEGASIIEVVNVTALVGKFVWLKDLLYNTEKSYFDIEGLNLFTLLMLILKIMLTFMCIF